jgi:transposase
MKEWVAHALRCTDTFHIVQWAAELLDELRKQSWRKAAPKGRRARLRKGEKASPRKEGRCIREGPKGPPPQEPREPDRRQKAALQLTAILQPRLHRAYLLKEGIRLALKLPANEIREGIEKWGAGPGTRGSPKFVEL